MPTLRLVQTPLGDERYRVELQFIDGSVPRTASVIEWLWQGELESPALSFGRAADELLAVKIGKPAWWDEGAFGDAWIEQEPEVD